MAQLDALAARLVELEKPGASADDQQLAWDIRDHLSSLSPRKPTPYLLAAYEALARGESPRFSIRGPEANREGGAADALTDVIFNIRRPDFDLAHQREAVLLALVNGDHPTARPLFERLIADRPTPKMLGLAIRYFANSGDLRESYDLIETEAIRRIGGLDDAEAAQLSSDAYVAVTGQHFDVANPAWRSDPYVAGRWPEIALNLFWDGWRRNGDPFGFSAEMEALRPADYRSRPQVTRALAANSDEDVLVWAFGELERLLPTVSEDPEANEAVDLPLAVVVSSFG
ncbi:MAG: hypothetical protein EON87_18980, partial [Brevundimonas sp.]